MDNLRKILTQKKEHLPGSAAHDKMTPASRRKMNAIAQAISGAAVLIPIYKKADDYQLILIKRPEYNGVHSNQVSFPGGKVEYQDENLEATALRETYEEVGILPEKVEVMCSLSTLFIPVSNHNVTPFVGFLTEEPDFSINKKEVQYVIVTSLDHLLDPSTIKTTAMNFGTELIDVPYFDIDGEIVWGATAMILSEFLELLKS